MNGENVSTGNKIVLTYAISFVDFLGFMAVYIICIYSNYSYHVLLL